MVNNAINAVLLCLGIGAALVAKIMLVVAAFRVSAKWGFAVMLLPFGSLFFRKEFPEDAGFALKLGTVGVIIALAAGLALGPQLQAWSESHEVREVVAVVIPTPEPTPPPLTDDQKLEKADLDRWAEDLGVRRTAITPDDAIAVAAFNRDLATYLAARKEWERRVGLPAELEASPDP